MEEPRKRLIRGKEGIIARELRIPIRA